MDPITIGPNQWCILHLEEDDSFSNVLLQTDAFTEAEEILIFVGLLPSVLLYTRRSIDGKLICRIVTYDSVAYDTVAGGVGNQNRVMASDRVYISSF